MSEFTQEELKEATAKIAELVQESYGKLGEAEEIADKYGLPVRFEYEYGMGGVYTSKKKYMEANDIENEEDVEEYSKWGSPNYGWYSSSQSC